MMMYSMAPLLDPVLNNPANSAGVYIASSMLELEIKVLELFAEKSYDQLATLQGLTELTNLNKLANQLPDFLSIAVSTALDEQKVSEITCGFPMSKISV